MKISSVVTDLFYADGQTDRQADTHVEANSRFSHFCQRDQK